MKPKKAARLSSVPPPTCNRVDRCALRVVVYRAPGPDDALIADHARQVVESHSHCEPRGGLGYITLVASDFDRLWKGVERGDALGTAFSVIRFLGPSAAQFIGREADFIFGWIGAADELWGEMLVLEIMPRPHLLAAMN